MKSDCHLFFIPYYFYTKNPLTFSLGVFFHFFIFYILISIGKTFTEKVWIIEKLFVYLYKFKRKE